jgi:hypothetical protein
MFPSGNVLIGSGTRTDAGFKLDVNGTARVSDNLTVSKSQNGQTSIFITNATNNNAVSSVLRLTTGGDSSSLGKYSSSTTPYKILGAGDVYLYHNSASDIALFNDNLTGKIKFAAGAVSTAQMTLTAAGRLLLGTTTESTYIFDTLGDARIRGKSEVVYNNGSAENGFFVQNTNTSTSSYTGIALKQPDGTIKAGFQYIHSNFSFAPLANTVLFASTGQSKLGFVANSGADGGVKQDIFFATYSGNNNVYIYGSSGNVVIQNGGTFTDIASAQLQLSSTTKGFLPPRGTNTQMLAIASPATGLMFYDTTNNKLNCYDGTTWQACW